MAAAQEWEESKQVEQEGDHRAEILFWRGDRVYTLLLEETMTSRSHRWAGAPSSLRCHTIDVRTVGDMNGRSRSCSAELRTIASATRRLSVATMLDSARTTPAER